MHLQLELAFRPSLFLRRMASHLFCKHPARSPRVCGRALPVPQVVEATVESARGMTVSEIIDVMRAMFSGGSAKSGPTACAIEHGASEPCDGLLVDAWQAITKVMKPCARKGRRLCDPLKCAVHVQCDPLDKEEMMGYLISALLGYGLLPKASVRPVREAARLRAVKVEPAITALQRKCNAAAAGPAASSAADDLRALRAKIEVHLPLPSKRQCDGATAAALKRQQQEPEVSERDQQRARWEPLPEDSNLPRSKLMDALLQFERPELEDCDSRDARLAGTVPRACHDPALQKWCARHRWPIRTFEMRRNSRRLRRAVLSRLRRPQGPEESARLACGLACDAQRLDLCTCADPRQKHSWLCRVSWCYATAAGSPCGEGDQRPGMANCDCMIGAWGELDGTPGEPQPVYHSANSQRVPRWDFDASECTKFKWLDPPPGGWYGYRFCPDRAGDLLDACELGMAQDYRGRRELLSDYPNFGMEDVVYVRGPPVG